jgi:hypothetical protein
MGFTLFQDHEFSKAWDHLEKSLESGYDLGSPDMRRVAYQLARRHGTTAGRALVLEALKGIERWVVPTAWAFMAFYLTGCGLAVAGQSVKSMPIMLLATAVCGWLAFSLAYLCWACCTKAVLVALGIVLVVSWAIALWPGFSESLDRYSWVFGVGLGLAAIVGITILVFQALAAGRDPDEA